jgi:TP901-1 family phage major tail protein
MGSCNTTRNEKGGKDLLLKICEELTGSVAVGTLDVPTAVLITAHGAVVNDLVRFPAATLGTNADVTAGTLYYVKAVLSSGSFSISLTPGGAAIVFTTAIASGIIEIFKTVGGLRSKSFSFASEGVDVSNHGSNQWREMLDGAGMRTVSISGEGVYTSATNYRALENHAFANEITCLAFVDVVGGRIYFGCFKIVSIEASAEFNGEATYSLSAENAAAITIQQAA